MPQLPTARVGYRAQCDRPPPLKLERPVLNFRRHWGIPARPPRLTPLHLTEGDRMPEQLDTKILPLLPLSSGVVLPTMVVTITLETEEAKAAIEAARSADDTLLLVPRTPDGRYARVGTVAHIEEMGRTPGGQEALILRGLHRALIGSGI